MYEFAFVRTVNGKSKTETFVSTSGAHAAMGVYAGQHDLNIHINDERWRKDSKSVMYEGDNPMFNIIGYVFQINDETMPGDTKKQTIKKRSTGKRG
jgi:hypothetical protein